MRNRSLAGVGFVFTDDPKGLPPRHRKRSSPMHRSEPRSGRPQPGRFARWRAVRSNSATPAPPRRERSAIVGGLGERMGAFSPPPARPRSAPSRMASRRSGCSEIGRSGKSSGRSTSSLMNALLIGLPISRQQRNHYYAGGFQKRKYEARWSQRRTWPSTNPSGSADRCRCSSPVPTRRARTTGSALPA